MADIKTIREDKIEEIKEAEGWECQGKNAAKDPEEFENRYIAKMLADYISEDDNYVVDKAVISCSHMSGERVEIIWDKEKIKLIIRDGYKEGDSIEVPNIGGEDPPYDHYYWPEVDEEGIRILRAVHASEQTDNGIPFATVIDCTCQRDVDEGKTQDKASILSFGNCSILKDTDIQEIERRHDKAVKYGTCYCLMKPVKEWRNPFCMESVVGDYEGINPSKPDIFNVGARGIQQPRPECKIISHHKTMEWSTAHGKKEGLTMLSTLLCTRGGIISIEFSGQIQTDAEVETSKELPELVTLEDLDKFGFYIGADNAERSAGLEELNSMLQKYGITSDDEIAFFMGQVAHETGYGARTIEKFDGSPETYFYKMYEGRSDLGNTQEGDGQLFRGGGYLNLTGRANYENFSAAMNDSRILTEGYKIVGGEYNRPIEEISRSDLGVIDVGEYAWESAAWFWTEGNPSGENFNTFVAARDWKAISTAINPNGEGTFFSRNEKINEFYEILTGVSLGLPE